MVRSCSRLAHFAFVFQYVKRGDGLQLELLAPGGQRLVGVVQRGAFDPLIFVGADQVPVYVGDLRDRADDLQLEGLVGDLPVVARDAQVAQVGSEAEAGEQLLLEENAIIDIKLRVEQRVGAVVRDAIVIERCREGRPGGEGLGITEVADDGIGAQDRNVV